MWMSRKKLIEMQNLLETHQQTLEKLKNLPVIYSIDRRGRENVFTFMRNGKTFQIHTMGLISDDINGWRKELFE